MIFSTTIHTAHGYSVEITRVGLEYDLMTSNALGDVISTVRMNEAETVALWANMKALTSPVGKAA